MITQMHSFKFMLRFNAYTVYYIRYMYVIWNISKRMWNQPNNNFQLKKRLFTLFLQQQERIYISQTYRSCVHFRKNFLKATNRIHLAAQKRLTGIRNRYTHCTMYIKQWLFDWCKSPDTVGEVSYNYRLKLNIRLKMLVEHQIYVLRVRIKVFRLKIHTVWIDV